MTNKSTFTLNVNAKDISVSVEARKTLADTLREDCGLTGTKVGCEHGVCGACTVLLDGEPIRSCLMFAVQGAGMKVTTVESLANNGDLNELQQTFVDNHALQCGFCTPGYLMLLTGALESKADLTDDDIVDIVSSNLCRCTGYQNIIKAVRQYVCERSTRINAA